jgi:hypothetical protein
LVTLYAHGGFSQSPISLNNKTYKKEEGPVDTGPSACFRLPGELVAAFIFVVVVIFVVVIAVAQLC